MNDLELQKLVEDISEQYFNKPFQHKARFNSRLRTTGGRYLLRSHDLEFNVKSFEKHGLEELISIIKHELCHYHLHLDKKGFSHRDSSFKECLKKVAGSRYAKPLEKKRDFRYLLKCKDCGNEYYRKNKMNPNKYRCGKCNGRLVLLNIKK